jgi:ribosomal protein S17E
MFDATFAGNKQAQEEVTMVLEKDGVWRVAGYYIR